MKIRISIVDDHNLYRKGVIQIFEQHEEFEIVNEFKDGVHYVNYLENDNTDNIDIVLLDYHMPVMDGVDVCKWIKINKHNVKVIIVSQYDNSLVIQKFAENGASGYLLKSASVEELGDAIREVYHNGFYFNEFLANETVVELVQNKKINPIFKETIKLTQREREVAELICAQLSYKEIANKLGISKRTVESHKNHILEKIGATKVTGIVVYAAKKGWV
tara:strand:- start:14393 stop:15046 length:654 start_codon:yes stop_codon:yes gene_type:complete